MKKNSILTFGIALLVMMLFSFQITFAEDLCTTVPGGSQIPVYRLYNSVNGEHLYTTSIDEVRNLTANHGWKDEGTGWYAPESGDPVFRLYSPVLRNHLYTTDQNEVNVLTAQQGWSKDNGGLPVFYSGGSVDIYRVYNRSNGMHHLTTDAHEYETLPAQGWNQEGVALHGIPGGTGETAYPVGNRDISNVDSVASIQADVTLNGSGSGYHAKLVACTPTSATSYGIQFDSAGPPPYTGKPSFLVENVVSNNPGGQRYVRTGPSAVGKTFRILLAVKGDGICEFYVNGNLIDTIENPNLAGQDIVLRTEASGRLNGDNVNATFSNIKLKDSGAYDASQSWRTQILDSNSGIKSNTNNFESGRTVTIQGTVEGLTPNLDWDNAYDRVSGVVHFVKR